VIRRALMVLAVAAGACATGVPDPDAVQALDGFAIAPYGIHEACFTLRTGDRLDWRFESREPVDFNLHYHEGAAVLMPVTLLASYGSSGIFPVLAAQDYCAMWEAGPAGAVIAYRLKPIRADR